MLVSGYLGGVCFSSTNKSVEKERGPTRPRWENLVHHPTLGDWPFLHINVSCCILKSYCRPTLLEESHYGIHGCILVYAFCITAYNSRSPTRSDQSPPSKAEHPSPQKRPARARHYTSPWAAMVQLGCSPVRPGAPMIPLLVPQ